MATRAPILFGLRSGLLLTAASVLGLVYQGVDWLRTGSWHGPSLRNFITFFTPIPSGLKNVKLIQWLLDVPVVFLAVGALVFWLSIEADIRHMKEQARRLNLTNRQ
jgi:hypothetical protein